MAKIILLYRSICDLKQKLVNVRDDFQTDLAKKMPDLCKIIKDIQEDPEKVESKIAIIDRSKREALLADLIQKDTFLIDLLKEKEGLDKELATSAQLNFVHRTFVQVK